MYMRYEGIKYEYDGKPTDQKTGLVISVPSLNLKLQVKTWAPTKPIPKPMSFEVGAGVASCPGREVDAVQVSFSTVNEDKITTMRTPEALLRIIKNFKQVPFTVKLSFSRDVLSHTDGALKQELISALATDDWGKFQITDYVLVGFEKPDVVYISGNVGYNTKVR